MNKFRTFAHPGTKTDNEVNRQPSMTVPDQTMSIKEIERRFGAGLPLGGGRKPSDPDTSLMDEEDLIHTDILHINPATLDLAERAELRDAVNTELGEIKHRDRERRKPKPVKEEVKSPQDEQPK